MDHLTGSQIRFKKNEEEITALIIGTYIKPTCIISRVWINDVNSSFVEGVASETYILCMEMKLPAKVFHHVRAQDILDMPGVSMSIIQANS